MPFVLTPEQVVKENIRLVGGKGANLVELINSGFPVPECFFVTTEAYLKFIEENQIREKILDILNKADFSDVNSLENTSEQIKILITNAKIPLEIKHSIIKAYRNLMYEGIAGLSIEFIRAGREQPFVAVRSSAVTEDISKASSAGQYETFLNVRGEENLILNVQRCWASLYTPRAIYYRHKNNQPQETSIGVIVQRMVFSDNSGVVFTIDPTNPVEGSNKIVIEACWGLGETLVQGAIEPDRYVVDKNTGKILEKNIGKKNVLLTRDPISGLNIKKDVSKDKVEAQVLSDNEIVTLAAYCKKIEQHYNYPQDIEYAIERGRIYIVQTRAVTTLEEKKEEFVSTETPILSGFGASPGIARGKVKIIHSVAELNKIETGDVLVTEMTSPDYVVAMEKSAAIVTNSGGSTCHAAIVSRELGIPCIVGTKNATEILKDDMEITVDATHGQVFSGEISIEVPIQEIVKEEIKTVTEVKVNLAFPETAEKALGADGVGLLRLEHMLTKAGLHPIEYIRERKQEELIQIIIDGVGKVAKVFYPRPVWVRSLDARTDEFRNMQGGEKEPTEFNPMLGWHGIRRSLDEPEILRCELTALKRLYEQGLDNVEMMLPFIIDVSELRNAKEIANAIGFTGKFGIMCETPACALTIEEFCKEGISFVSFGTNDLSMLVLGVDRNEERISKLYNTFHPSILRLMKDVIDTSKRYNVKTSICGEAGSDEKMAEILVEYGIDSISANIDALNKIRNAVFNAERKLLLSLKKKI